jgi:uncharacterized RDD family membrane protein YckC
LLRYWDGRHWTEHSRSKEQAMQPAYAGAGPAGASQAPAAVASRAMMYPATPDGQYLAGWWQRVGAYLIDSIIVGIIGGILASPWIGDLMDAYRAYFDQVLRDAEAGRQTAETTVLEQQMAGPMLAVILIFMAVQFVYNVGFLMTLQATPGKLALGLRVRLRSRPGPMPVLTVLLRWVAQFGISILNVVPFAGMVVGIYGFLDIFWPLWDGKKQALHDKVARTNVVRVR